MVHALSSLYRRNFSSPDLQDYVRDYLAVQYNALLDFATVGGNIYGISWTGDPGTQLNPISQTAALTVLISAITLENSPSSAPVPAKSSSAPPDPSPTDSTHTHQPPSNRAIIGGSVGGVLVVVGLGIGIWWLLCRRRRDKVDKAPGTHKDHGPFFDGVTSNHLAVSPFTEHLRNRGEPVQSLGGTSIISQSHQQETGHLASTRRSAPTSSYRSSFTNSTGQGTSSVNELVAELRTLRLQQSRLLERAWEEEDSPPPQYYSVRSARSEQCKEAKEK
ncbi:hypothetical protein PM082_015370 [Marasmius tenuissimus]|nr:hypothetical protein PM082_015370 [Marasmius tenuissimus]